jgi:hypothetical protein
MTVFRIVTAFAVVATVLNQHLRSQFVPHKIGPQCRKICNGQYSTTPMREGVTIPTMTMLITVS